MTHQQCISLKRIRLCAAYTSHMHSHWCNYARHVCTCECRCIHAHACTRTRSLASRLMRFLLTLLLTATSVCAAPHDWDIRIGRFHAGIVTKHSFKVAWRCIHVCSTARDAMRCDAMPWDGVGWDGMIQYDVVCYGIDTHASHVCTYIHIAR